MENPGIEKEHYKERYRISSARMENWDYGSHGLYYVTICTLNRIHYFGGIVSENQSGPSGGETQNIASLLPTALGKLAYANWLDIPNHFSFVELDDFVIMPNHTHGILFINNPHKEIWQPNKFGVQSQNLGAVIRDYKASVKTYATKNAVEFGWQPRYYDHVIRSEKEYINIKGYIKNNPQEWFLKGDNEDNVFRLQGTGQSCQLLKS
ncbi:MAG TPA: transposase [Mucilaginibacter sp.]|nr:transposase [Mucilaginibacter sp.]